MSISNIIDPATRKFYPELIPPPIAVVPNLNQVLNAGNSASTIGDPQTIENLEELETQKIYQGNYLQLELGESGDTVLLKGASALGTLHVGNGLSIEKLPVGANGTVLKANSASITGLGVEWSSETGDVESVSAGTNITMTGTGTNPIVNLSAPLTSDLLLGSVQIIGANGAFGETISTTGDTYAYSSGGVDTTAQSAVASNQAQHTIKYENAGSELVSIVETAQVDNATLNMISNKLSTSNVASVSMSCNTAGTFPNAGFGCGVSAPTSPPFPDITASIGISCPDTSNPALSLSQSAPFASSFQTTLDKTGLSITETNSNYGGLAQLLSTGGSSQVFVSGINNSTANSHYVRIETPLTGDAIIEHNTVGTARNLGISTQGNLTLTGDNIDVSSNRFIFPSLAGSNFLDYTATAGRLLIQQTTTGGGANPMLTLNQNDTATGSATLQFKKNISTNGSAIGEMSFLAKTAISPSFPEREYARIAGTIRNNASGNVDGSLTLQTRINDTLTEIMRINGADSQIEIYQPLDLNDKDIVSSTGDVDISANGSTTTGNVNITAKGDCSIVSNGAGGAINLTSVSNVNITATGDNLTLTAGTTMILDCAVVELKNTNTTTTTPNHNASIQTTSNGVATNTFLKLKLGLADIWIPYFTTDPSL